LHECFHEFLPLCSSIPEKRKVGVHAIDFFCTRPHDLERPDNLEQATVRGGIWAGPPKSTDRSKRLVFAHQVCDGMLSCTRDLQSCHMNHLKSKESGTAPFCKDVCKVSARLRRSLTLLELGLSQADDKLVHLDHELIPCSGFPPHWISEPSLFYHRPHKVEQLQLCSACESLYCLRIYRGVWEK
jgi:hypothetical protein